MITYTYRHLNVISSIDLPLEGLIIRLIYTLQSYPSHVTITLTLNVTVILILHVVPIYYTHYRH